MVLQSIFLGKKWKYNRFKVCIDGSTVWQMVNISDLNNCAVQPSAGNQDQARKNVNGKCEINREKSLAGEAARNGKVVCIWTVNALACKWPYRRDALEREQQTANRMRQCKVTAFQRAASCHERSVKSPEAAETDKQTAKGTEKKQMTEELWERRVRYRVKWMRSALRILFSHCLELQQCQSQNKITSCTILKFSDENIQGWSTWRFGHLSGAMKNGGLHKRGIPWGNPTKRLRNQQRSDSWEKSYWRPFVAPLGFHH